MKYTMIKNKYIVITPDSTNYIISDDFDTLEKAMTWGIHNNWGRGFQIAKRVDYEIKEKND